MTLLLAQSRYLLYRHGWPLAAGVVLALLSLALYALGVVPMREQVAELADGPDGVLLLPPPVVPLMVGHVGPGGVAAAGTRGLVVQCGKDGIRGTRRRQRGRCLGGGEHKGRDL